MKRLLLVIAILFSASICRADAYFWNYGGQTGNLLTTPYGGFGNYGGQSFNYLTFPSVYQPYGSYCNPYYMPYYGSGFMYSPMPMRVVPTPYGYYYGY